MVLVVVDPSWLMVALNVNAERDMVFVPYYETFDCDTALVKWGQKGRFGDPAIVIEHDLSLVKHYLK